MLFFFVVLYLSCLFIVFTLALGERLPVGQVVGATAIYLGSFLTVLYVVLHFVIKYW